jgi:outer membrane protein assembly factor BamB
VAWAAVLPGRSAATPIVWGDHVFVVSPDLNKQVVLFCLDRSTGDVRWQQVLGSGERTVGKNNLASCSPVTDGKRVYAMAATGDLAAFDFGGKELWRRRLAEEFGAFAVQFLYGASPLLWEGRLYLGLLQHNPAVYPHAQDGKPERQSWLVCLDPETGQTTWRQERKSAAPDEAMEAYTTPIPGSIGGRNQIILVGADCVTGHRPESGAEIWRFSGLNVKKNPGGRIVPSPVVTQDRIFACGPKREVLVALRADDVGSTEEPLVAWRCQEYVPDVCTPLAYQGKLFVLDGDRQMLTCFQPVTGEKLWQGKLGVREIFYSSPTGADGKIYCLSEEGTVVVLSAGKEFEVLNTMRMGEGANGSSIAAAGGALFVRTASHLYCIRRPKP